MTCKDCACSEVCYYKAFNDEKFLKKRRDDVEKICKSFVHRDRLKNSPTVDAVEVVRCKDCVYAELSEDGDLYCDGPIGICGTVGFNDFCSCGERRGNDGNL